MVGSILAFLNAPARKPWAHDACPARNTPRQSQTYAFACADGTMLGDPFVVAAKIFGKDCASRSSIPS